MTYDLLLNIFSSNEICDDKSALEKLLAMYKELLVNAQGKMASLIHKNTALPHRLHKILNNKSNRSQQN
jgi:hypothetical protein